MTIFKSQFIIYRFLDIKRFKNKFYISFMPWFDFDNFTNNRTHHPRRCFLRIWIACMCHFVNYASFWYEWRSNKVNIIWIWTHSSKIEHNHVNILFFKMAYSFYLFSFMQFLNAQTNIILESCFLLILESICYCQHVKWYSILVTTKLP